ncbi:MAG: hypothetical protein DWG80_05880 [Chloroflexi bacterium]|nr:hypothetical protein [Chloroflexota bacterium]
MERIELLAMPGGLPTAAGYVQASLSAGEYRIYPARGTRARWLGRTSAVRFLDGREAVLVVTEIRTRQVTWLIGREQ